MPTEFICDSAVKFKSQGVVVPRASGAIVQERGKSNLDNGDVCRMATYEGGRVLLKGGFGLRAFRRT